jgi:hypothetical protein
MGFPSTNAHMAILNDYVVKYFDAAAADFRLSAGGENWTKLEDAMWALQAVQKGGLTPSELEQVINTQPIPDWIPELVRRHKDLDA